jgi:hypothetical protein
MPGDDRLVEKRQLTEFNQPPVDGVLRLDWVIEKRTCAEFGQRCDPR